ncbi:MAG: copper homeostasis protein CutC [Saprospiraceae bacterium]
MAEFEVCIDSLEGALAADKFGADRVELCSALYEGGLTPSHGLIKACVEQSQQDIFVMIRPEAGGFCYTTPMVEVMKTDIVAAAELGAKGVVFGILHADQQIDFSVTRVLVELAHHHQLQAVFHRAFDFCPDPEMALSRLIELGVDRLLTSGQAPKAIQGSEMIRQLVAQSQGRIEIMAGSGVMPENAKILIDTGVAAIHFTAGKIEEELQLGMGVKYVVDEQKIERIMQHKRS